MATIPSSQLFLLLVGLLISHSLKVMNVEAFTNPHGFTSNSLSSNLQFSLRTFHSTNPTSKSVPSRLSVNKINSPILDLSTLSLSNDNSDAAISSDEDKDTKTPILSKINQWRKGIFQKKEDDVPFKQKLAKMGLSVLLSYGFVSNMSYAVSISLSWYVFCKTKLVSPLAPGQWKPFLAVYAGFYVFNNVIRPLRLAVSAYVATYFDRIIAFAQRKINCSKGVAIGLTVFVANVLGTTAAMCLGISLASAATGVPIFVK